ncbi:MAG: GNAT family N-acetyltransferase [Burkholderiaceae bacterium]|nr:GNAT family N-acetyltransferase [Burkholderiaceae bacterium]
MPLLWSCHRFEELGADGVYDMLALRAKVFILEQGPYLDPDGADRQAWHLLGRDAGSAALLAYLRVLDAGVKFADVSIGRVVVDARLRGRGVGHQLVREGLALCERQWPGQPITISAQSHLQDFYRRHGFQTVSAEYVDDGIPHVDMRRSG